MRRYSSEMRGDIGYPFFVFRKEDRALVGGITLNNIRRGVAQAVSIGYWMGAPYARKGHMSAALTALLPFAHSAMRLKRIEAACLPHNAASIRLLEKLSFQREGYARQYLCIAGEWQDHLLYARLSSDPV
jgi:ribosomal-protein-alanine N-acetyltransferase